MDKVALITGVQGGIGSASAKAFASKGWFVYGLDRLEPTAVPENAQYLQCDISNPAELEAAVAAIARSVDHIDALVNNAATPDLQTAG